MNTIRVLYVLNDLKNGGTEAFVMNYYRLLDKQKFHADFLVFSGDNLYYKEEIIASGGSVYVLSNDNYQDYLKNYGRMKGFLGSHQYDIIHIHSCSIKFLIQTSTISKRAKGSIVIGHAHSVGEPTGSTFDRIIRTILKSIICHNLDYGMACSEDSAEEKYTKKFLKSQHFKMIPNAIDTSKYAYNEVCRARIRKEYGLDKQFVIGIVGRLEKWKNQSFLMEAVQIANNDMDVYMMAIGDGDIREDLENKAKSLDIEKKVIFTGMVDNANEYYSALDLFCLPSFGEGFPFVLVEAQANGLKCIISDEITRETDVSRTSEFLPIKEPAVWAKAILQNCNSRLTSEESERVQEKYEVSNAVRELERIYEAAVSEEQKHGSINS